MKEKISSLLLHRQPLTTGEIDDRVKISPRETRAILVQMVEDGVLVECEITSAPLLGSLQVKRPTRAYKLSLAQCKSSNNRYRCGLVEGHENLHLCRIDTSKDVVWGDWKCCSRNS